MGYFTFLINALSRFFVFYDKLAGVRHLMEKVMKKRLTALIILSLLVAGNGSAMDSKSHDESKHEGMTSGESTKQGTMDHGSMNHGSSHEGGTFKHEVMVDGIHVEFQVMDLASMNMKDPEGRTHHVMASFLKDNEKIEKAVGKVKVIAPSGKEQTATLEDFGSGVFASNFTFDEKGKWGVICLFKDKDGKHTAKFWYHHGTM